MAGKFLMNVLANDLVGHHIKILASNWVSFDFDRAIGSPVKGMDDASLRTLSSDRGGRMLIVGIGAGAIATGNRAREARP